MSIFVEIIPSRPADPAVLASRLRAPIMDGTVAATKVEPAGAYQVGADGPGFWCPPVESGDLDSLSQDARRRRPGVLDAQRIANWRDVGCSYVVSPGPGSRKERLARFHDLVDALLVLTDGVLNTNAPELVGGHPSGISLPAEFEYTPAAAAK